VEGGKGKGVALEMSMGDYSVRHRCAFESICALANKLSDVQNKAVWRIVWASVLEYKRFMID